MRDRVDTPPPIPGRLAAGRVERGPHGPDDQVTFLCGRGLLPRAGHLDRDSVGDDPCLDHVVQRQRQAQGVETRPRFALVAGERTVTSTQAQPQTVTAPLWLGRSLRPGRVAAAAAWSARIITGLAATDTATPAPSVRYR